MNISPGRRSGYSRRPPSAPRGTKDLPDARRMPMCCGTLIISSRSFSAI